MNGLHMGASKIFSKSSARLLTVFISAMGVLRHYLDSLTGFS